MLNKVSHKTFKNYSKKEKYWPMHNKPSNENEDALEIEFNSNLHDMHR